MTEILKIFLFLLVSMLYCNAQNNLFSDFIPKGYTEYETYFGDLNKDGKEDCVVVIKKTNPDNIITNRFDDIVDRNRRGIIVLFKNGEGYKLVDKNYDCFSSENEDGGVYFPPELQIEIKNEKLYIAYYHGRYGHWEYTFRFQNSNFELIGYDSNSNFGPRINEITSINFLSKRN